MSPEQEAIRIRQAEDSRIDMVREALREIGQYGLSDLLRKSMAAYRQADALTGPPIVAWTSTATGEVRLEFRAGLAELMHR